jgi:hypothetical protein
VRRLEVVVVVARIIFFLKKKIRGFIPKSTKGDRVLGHNIIVVPNLRYGLKRRSGTFGSISDLNEGLVQ